MSSNIKQSIALFFHYDNRAIRAVDNCPYDSFLSPIIMRIS